MAQRIRPLLLLKKQLGAYQRLSTNVYGIGNRLVGKGFRATALQASVGSDDVTVFFNEDVVVTDPASGVTITVNGNAATFTAVKGTRSMVYTLTSQNPVDYDDVIVWTYDSTAAGLDPYTGQDSGEELADTTLQRQMPSQIVAPTWGTVTLPTVNVGQGWSTNLNSFITDNGGQAPTFTLAAGALPDGITLNSNGTFSGVATTPDTGNATFTATNSGGSADSNSAGWRVTTTVSAPTWSTVTLPTVAIGSGWSTNLNDFITDDGGESPTFSIAAGVLPDGITLNSNGTFSGTATTDGTGSVTFAATNTGGSTNSNNAGWTVTVTPAAPVVPLAGWTGLENCA